jgi:isoquinoline 1-oxidoreductase beta subunit
VIVMTQPHPSSSITDFQLSRRGFLVAAAAGGLSIGMALPLGEAAAQAATPEINAWVLIRPDDTIVVRIARVEMGQGTLTGLCQLVAEELNADWSKVTWEYPTPGQNVARNRVWGNFQTAGSQGIRQSQDYVRKGGAAARMMLVQAAADQWGVPAADCRAEKGVVTHAASGRSTTYGKVADAASKLQAPTEIALRDPKDWTIAGKSLKRLDTPDKINGKQLYSIDLRQPGMLNAAIKACPVFGGKVASFDADKVKGMAGVKAVLQVGDDAVAVVADTWWRARKALEALPVAWNEGANAGMNTPAVLATLREGLEASEAFVGNERGGI